MTTTSATAIQTLIDDLNAYAGDNIWEVILSSDLYDEAASDLVDEGQDDRLVTTDGVMIRWNAQTDRWEEANWNPIDYTMYTM